MNALHWSDIVEGRRRGAAAALARIALLPPSLAYRLGVAARNRAFDLGLLCAARLSRPVVSVGNLAVGGTGKTPFVKLLARALAGRGVRVAVLSRGYGASPKGPPFPRIVSDGERVLLDALEAGDEACMLARELPGTVVAVDPDRARAGGEVARRFAADIFLLDDGFQHRRLARDADILLLDGARPFGPGRLLPAGFLREPPSAASRAGAIVFTRCHGPVPPGILACVRRFNPRAAVFAASCEPARVVETASGAAHPPSFLRGRAVGAFCGIAGPGEFGRTLCGLGASVVLARPFPDHHRYTREEVERTAADAAGAGAGALVTTSKDAVRLPAGLRLGIPVFSLEIEMKIGGGAEQLLQWVTAATGPARGAGRPRETP